MGDRILRSSAAGGKENSMEFDVKEFGAHLKRLRLEKGVTQEKMASDLCISWDHLCRVERGNRGCSLILAIDIANYFGVGLDYLVFGQSKNQTAMQVRMLAMAEELKAMSQELQ